jgi:hypothetical protein
VLQKAAGQQFYNASPLTMPKLLDNPTHIADHLHSYVQKFSVTTEFDIHGTGENWGYTDHTRDIQEVR